MSSKWEPVSIHFSASKSGSEKSKNRTSSTTASFPIRYRSLEEYDDEEYSLLTFEKPDGGDDKNRRSSTFSESTTTPPNPSGSSFTPAAPASSSSSSTSSSLFSSSLSFLSSPSPLSSHPLSEPTTTTTTAAAAQQQQQQQQPPSSSSSPSPSPSTLSPSTAVVPSSPSTATTTSSHIHASSSSLLSSSSSPSATTPTSPSTTTTTEALSSWSSQTPPAAPPPPKAVISPSKTSAGENDKKTLLANIRGKLHRKWEELSGDSSSSSSSSNLLSNSNTPSSPSSSSSTDNRENSENRDNERKFPSSSPVRKQNSDEGVGSGSGSGVFSESSPHPSPYKVPTSSTFPGTNTAAPCSSSSSSFFSASSSKSPAAMDSSVDGALSEQIEQGEELTEDHLTTTTANTTTSTSLAAEDDFAFPSENLLVYRTSDGTNTVQLSPVGPALTVPPVRSTRMSLRERLRGSSSSSSSKNSSSGSISSSRQRNQKAPKLPPLEPAPIKMSYLQRQNSAPNSATFTVEDDFEEFVDNDGRIYYDVEDDDDSDDTNDRDRGTAATTTTTMKTKKKEKEKEKEKRSQSRQKKTCPSSSSSSLLLLGSDRDDKAGTASLGGGGAGERLADGSSSLSSSSSSGAGAGCAVSNLDQKRQAHQLRKRGHNSANSDHVTDNENSSPSSSTSIPSSFSSASSGAAAANGPAREGRTLRLPPTQRLVVVSVCMFLYLIMPMPSYLSGAIFGCVVTSLAWLAYFRLKKACYSGAPSRRANLSPPVDGNDLATAAASLSISQLPPLLVPEMKEPKLEDTIIYKGWMNELFYYDSDNYHINKTNSVYVRLEGVTLRLSTPKTNVPKRAMFDENLSNPTFISQRHYDLNNCRVFVLPAGLVKKRLWSKKYPICVDLSTNSAQKSAGGNSGGSSGQKKSSSKDSSICPSPSTELGFEIISEEACNPTILYLFARTGREKEEWFKRFQAASLGAPLGNHILDIRNALKAAAADATETGGGGSSSSSSNHKRSDSDTNIVGTDGFHRHRRHNSSDSVTSSSSGTTTPVDSTFDHLSPDSAGHHHHHHHQQQQQQQQQQHTNMKKFSQYMAKLMPATFDAAKSNSNSSGGSSVRSRRESQSVSASSTPSSPTGREVHCPDLPSTILDFSEPQLLWINALIGRCLWDFLQDKSWTEKVIEKLQKKLSKIHVPYFIEELKITDIDLGTSIPILQKSSKPYLDERGFWVNFQTMYTGGFKMTISTKVNLMKLKKNSLEKSPVATSRRSAVTDSNEEDSAESSTDEEPDDNGLDDSSSSGGALPPSGAGGSGTSRKILRYIDMITQSKYFQQATEYKYIKKAMEGVSNTPLILTVEVHSLNGVLTINVPPPPTDRLWYGFRDNPQLTLVAKPKVGEREVTVTHVTEWIEKKLTIEFQRIFVLPNMDDLVIPVLLSGLPEDAVPSTVCPPGGTERLLVLPNMDDLSVPIMTNPLKEFDEDSTTTTTTTTNNNNNMSRPLKKETMATEH